MYVLRIHTAISQEIVHNYSETLMQTGIDINQICGSLRLEKRKKKTTNDKKKNRNFVYEIISVQQNNDSLRMSPVSNGYGS